ncbi:MAG TPA: sugar phosphate isomerase/epimerase [Planctomycetota bacterium]|nr:sugar phosphate isomerase/epimerase [Planctomycetota bacterium]
MQLGFITSGTVDDVKFARKFGFDCLEVALFGDTPLFNDCKDFRKACDAEGIPVSAVSLFGQNYTSPDAAVRKDTAKRLQKMADLAAKLAAPVVITGSGSGNQDMSLQRKWNYSIEVLKPLIEKIQAKKLGFAFYNCHWENEVNTPAAWEYVLPKLPGTGIKFDPSHPAYDNRDWTPDLLAAGPNILHAHAKDVLRVNGKLIPDPNPGLGEINWSVFFGLLYNAGYNKAVCIEPHSAVYTGDRRYAALELSGRFLRQFIL